MNRTTLLALAEHVEAGTATEQREMLEAAFVAVHGPKPDRVHGGSPELLAWLDRHNPFFALLQAGGFLDAAMSLVPSGWHSRECLWQSREPHWSVHIHHDTGGAENVASGYATTEALATVAASLRAIAGSMTDD